MKPILKPFALLLVLWGKVITKVWAALQKSLFAECGSQVIIGRWCTFTHNHIHIGSHVHIGERASFIAAISHIYIGDNVMFGPNVTIRGGNHRSDVIGEYMIRVTEKLPENDRDVVIEQDVWIGANATILSGVHVGEGSIIGAGSIVTKDVPPYTIIVGSPGFKQWERWDAETVARHKALLQTKYNRSAETSQPS